MHEDGHLIELREDGWTIAHPISERIDLDTLFDCRVTWTSGDVGVYGRFVLAWDDEQDDWVLGERLMENWTDDAINEMVGTLRAEVKRLTAENERLHFDYERLAERKPNEVADISREDSATSVPTSPQDAYNQDEAWWQARIGYADDEIEALKDEVVELRGWKNLAVDLADVLPRMVVGWEERLGVDLAQHPDVQRVMARFREMMGR